MKRHLIVLSLIAGLFFISTDVAYAQRVDDIIVDISQFLRNVILPFLISIAFLYFIVNLVRYFFLEGASDEGRTKAKRSAIYGIIAFVFIFSLWTITTIITQALNIEQSNSLCPDYLGGICNNVNRGIISSGQFGTISPGGSTGFSTAYGDPYSGGGTGRSGAGGSTGGGGTGGGSTGGSTGGGGTGGNTSGGGTGGGGVTGSPAGLAELVFGTGKDSAAFTTSAGDPRSIMSSPIIAEDASCEEGLEALTLASSVETTQSAYVLYQDRLGNTRWENITDLNSANHIGYDRDVLAGILNNGAQNAHIVHVHPQDRSEQQDLIMDGQGPSAADMEAMCELDNPNLTYLTVDWTGVWRMKQQDDTCPYTQEARTVLPLLETYNNLAAMEATQRADEVIKYTQSTIASATYREHFGTLNLDSLSSYSPEEILGLSASYQQYASTTIAYNQPVTEFCSTY